jgi:hypothetical protein
LSKRVAEAKQGENDRDFCKELVHFAGSFRRKMAG